MNASALKLTPDTLVVVALSFAVTLTVTNDRGVSASSVQSVSVAASPTPTASFVVSPPTPVVGQTVFFNGDASRAAPGRSIVQWTWDFGDGTASSAAISVSHTFSTGGTFIVVLTVRDDADQRSTTTAIVNVGSGNPIAQLFLSKVGGNQIQADASASTATGTSTIANYRFAWGDSTPDTSGPASSAPHTYAAPGPHTVTLTVTDSAGRSAVTSKDITTP